MTYQVDYAGYYTMSFHDREENALKRWFDNYKIGRYDSFAADTEWLVVKELPSATRRRKKRLVCEIGDDGRGTKREVVMDHTAPPAPILTFAAKRRYEPPPPKTAQELRKEAEWHHMMMMGYEPIRRPKRRRMLSMATLDSIPMMMDMEDDYEIEWVRRRLDYFEPPRTPYVAPPVRHRRNA